MMNIVICIKINKQGNGYLFKQDSRFLYLTLVKENREKKDRCWWEKRGAYCLSTSVNEVLRQLLCLFATSTVRSERKIKNITRQKEKAENFFTILIVVQVPKVRMLFLMLRLVKKKGIAILFILNAYQREQGRERQVQGGKVEERIVLV